MPYLGSSSCPLSRPVVPLVILPDLLVEVEQLPDFVHRRVMGDCVEALARQPLGPLHVVRRVPQRRVGALIRPHVQLHILEGVMLALVIDDSVGESLGDYVEGLFEHASGFVGANVVEGELNREMPRPTPKSRRPRLRWSNMHISWASLRGL